MIARSPLRQALTWGTKFVTIGLLLALLAGAAGPWAWPLELFANFRVQYAALFLACSLILLMVRQFAWACGAAAGVIFTVLSIFAYTGWPGQKTQIAQDGAVFKLITFNVWYRNRDLQSTARYLERSGADAVVLLELDRVRARELQGLLPSYRFAQIDIGPHGAVIFSRWPLTEQRIEPLCAGCVGISWARLDWRGRPLTLLGAHLHWPIGPVAAQLRARELPALAQLARQQSGLTLVGGDFNLTAWSRYYTQFLAASGLVDCAQGHGLNTTWPSSPRLLGIRIDHCFASPQWRTVAVKVGPDLGSDHLPNEVTLRLVACE